MAAFCHNLSRLRLNLLRRHVGIRRRKSHEELTALAGVVAAQTIVAAPLAAAANIERKWRPFRRHIRRSADPALPLRHPAGSKVLRRPDIRADAAQPDNLGRNSDAHRRRRGAGLHRKAPAGLARSLVGRSTACYPSGSKTDDEQRLGISTGGYMAIGVKVGRASWAGSSFSIIT